MKHTKYWMTLALCAAMALSLAACGSKAPAQDSTKDTQQTEAEDTVIGGAKLPRFPESLDLDWNMLLLKCRGHCRL